MDINLIINDIANKFFGGNNSEFAKEMDTSETNIRNYRSSRTPKLEFIIKLFKKFEISFDATFLKEEESNYITEPVNSIYRKTTDAIHDSQRIPLFNVEATLGLIPIINGNGLDNERVIDYISIPNLPKCDGAIYASGDSMYPLIKSGDIVAFKKIDFENIFYGEMYILSIFLDEDTTHKTVKFVQKSDLGDKYIKLVSQNEHHSPKDIKIDSIAAIGLIRASIRVHN